MKIGYACLLTGEPVGVLSSLTLSKVTASRWHEVVQRNLVALDEMLSYNISNNIKLFRMSSDLIPLATHPQVNFDWRGTYADDLARLGQKTKDAHMRVSMHPGQYTVLNSPKEDVVERAVADLIYHSDFMDLMGLDGTHKIILHIGGVYGDKAAAMERFVENYKILPANVRRRLVIENDDKSYTVEDVLHISERTGAPVVFDNLHHALNPPSNSLHHSEFEWMTLCKATWKGEDGCQKTHYSQQKMNALAGSHSQTIHLETFKSYYDQLPDHHMDVMLEVKDKNLSALKCLDLVHEKLTTGMLEKRWSKYKYLVLSRSASCYDAIRQLLKDKVHADAVAFYGWIDLALALEEDKGAEVNAAQHVWGYVNKSCTSAEKAKFEKMLKAYQNGEGKIAPVKKLLYKLAVEQQSEYLLNSYYFYKPFL